VVGGGAGLCLVGEVGLCHAVSVAGRWGGDQVRRPYVLGGVRRGRCGVASVVRGLYGPCTGPGPCPFFFGPRWTWPQWPAG
jgi:hypothetical protein